MSNSVVRVTEPPINDSLILVVGEDGAVTPDKATVESYLSSRTGATELQVMHVNKSDGRNIDVTVDTFTYLPNSNEEGYMKTVEEMDDIARILTNFRMDHDYTPLTSPGRKSPDLEENEVDELAQTLSMLEGSHPEQQLTKQTKRIKSPPKLKKTVPSDLLSPKTRNRPSNNELFKQPVKGNASAAKGKVLRSKYIEEAEAEEFEEDYALDSDDLEDDENDSDFELDEIPKPKPIKRAARSRTKSEPSPIDTKKLKTLKAKISTSPKQISSTKVELESPKVMEKQPELTEKPVEKKPIPKKEKKIPKPIPDDFALFSTPDIIRRVGGKHDGLAPSTPTTPESPKIINPAKIMQENRSKSMSERHSSTSKLTFPSSDGKVGDKGILSIDKTNRLIIGPEQKRKDRRASMEIKTKRPSVDGKVDRRFSLDKNTDTKKVLMVEPGRHNVHSTKTDQVTIQGLNESLGSSSNESSLENAQLEPLPSAEDVRAIIQNENTKSFTTSLVLSDTSHSSVVDQLDQSQMNLEAAALELDQSILDNIGTDLISEDILYQVAQSLVDNTELQNAIDKSLVDGNLVLDPAIHQAIAQDPIMQDTESTVNQDKMDMSLPMSSSPNKGTQIVRPDGRIVVLPPIERPTTRSRNRRAEDDEISKPILKSIHKPLDDEHVSGNELDSSSDSEEEEEEEEDDEDKSDDDPDKLWCICNQPHNNRFMICCDTCEEWYHGKCVNVTKAMGQLMEQEGREWICLYCKDPSLKRPAAAARRVRKASRASTDSASSQKKSSTSSLSDPAPSVPACIVCSKPSRTSSIFCSDACILKHAQGVEKVVVFERSTGKILSGSNAPSAANLEKWLQEHPGFEVVRSTSKPAPPKSMTQSKLKIIKNSANGGVSVAVQRKGVSIGVLQHTPKGLIQPQTPNKQHFKIVSKQVSLTQPKVKLIQAVPVPRSPTIITTPKAKVIQTTLKITSTTLTKDKPMPQKTPKSRQAEQVTPQPKQQENIRENVRKTLLEQLTNRLKMVEDLKLSEDEVTKISTEIESQLYKCFGDTGQKYRNKYRSLIFNIKDIKNQTLWRRICEKSVNPYQLVRLSPDDLASQELALWRERENKHQLDMIKKSELELLNCNRQYVFKTHKGEQVLEDGRPSDTVDNTDVITGLGADSTSAESTGDSKKDSKDKDRKRSKRSRHDRDKDHHDRKSSKDKEKSEGKDHRKELRSSSRDRDRRKRSRSRERASRHSERKRSRSKERDRHKRSSHKSSRHKKETHNTTEKLDKKSKEILEQLVDKHIVPPLEDRLWKHVPQDDITPAPMAESDSDHEPTSTVTIPTPPRSSDPEELLSSQASTSDVLGATKEISVKDAPLKATEPDTGSGQEDDGSRSPPPRSTADYIWKGTINMVDVAQISITAHEVSGDCSGLGEELPPCLDVVGRISPETVWDYIGKMKCSNSKAISLLRLNATNIEEKMPYIALYSYLSSRNRLGVIKSSNKAVKDFYILPLASQKPIPQSLLPISGPGFEESRPALLLGIIVRDKRKRPLFDPLPSTTSKRSKIEPPQTTTSNATANPARSYTPPPVRDPRIKTTGSVSAPSVTLSEETQDEIEDDMDEPYTPEDSDPESTPILTVDSSVSQLNATDISNILTGSVKSSSFLDSGLTAQTFEPFANKFDTIPGLDESTGLPANSQELLKKMEELDQRIAMQKAEIDNMSQNIASTADIGTSALASIALPSNLQQILDSIKGIGGVGAPGTEATQPAATPADSASVAATSSTDLTIPLMLPKISSRPLTGSAAAAAKLTPSAVSPTIPLNIPTKVKTKMPVVNSPLSHQADSDKTAKKQSDSDKSASVLSSLSEEDLIRKAAEMLGETDSGSSSTKKASPKIGDVSVKPVFSSPSFVSAPLMYTQPPTMVPPPPGITPPLPPTPPLSKRAKLDLTQPPVPGLEDEV